MSIYSLSVSNVSRAKMQSSTASYAYISGEEVKDERTGMVKKYSRDDKILAKGNILPDDAPQRYKDNAADWINDIELHEQADNARPCKKYVMALPRELDLEQQRAIVEQWIKANCTKYGYAATYAIHQSKDGQNPHVHILVANRALQKGKWQRTKSKTVYKLDEKGEKIPLLDENGKQKVRIRKGKGVEKLWEREKLEENYLDQKSTLKSMRESWATVCNQYLAPDKQIDHRSYAAQGKLQIPTRHEGHAARQLEARGGTADVCEYNRQVKKRNDEIKKELAELDEREAMRRAGIESLISDVEKEISPALKGKEALEVEGVLFDIKNMMYDTHAKELEAEAAKVLGVDRERAEVEKALAGIRQGIETAQKEHYNKRLPLLAEEREAGEGLENARRNLQKLEKAEEERMNRGFFKMLLSSKDNKGLDKASKALKQAEKRQLQAKTALSTLDGQHQARLKPLQSKAGQLEARAGAINQAIMDKVDEIGGKQVYGYKQIEAALSKFDNRHNLPAPAAKAAGAVKGRGGKLSGAVASKIKDGLKTGLDGISGGRPDERSGGFAKAMGDTVSDGITSIINRSPIGVATTPVKMGLNVFKNVDCSEVEADKAKLAAEKEEKDKAKAKKDPGISRSRGR